jgi:hypothetical protein
VEESPRGHSVARDGEWFNVYCFSGRADAEIFMAQFGGEKFDPGEEAGAGAGRDGGSENGLTPFKARRAHAAFAGAARCSSLLMRKDGVDLKCKADAEGEAAA